MDRPASRGMQFASYLRAPCADTPPSSTLQLSYHHGSAEPSSRAASAPEPQHRVSQQRSPPSFPIETDSRVLSPFPRSAISSLRL